MYGWPATKGDAQNVGYRAVGQMGAVGCLCHALDRYGTMDRPTVMRDAIALAADGWEVDWNLSLALALYYDRLAPIAASRAVFLRPSGAPQPDRFIGPAQCCPITLKFCPGMLR